MIPDETMKNPEIIKTCQTLPNIFATFKGVTQTNKTKKFIRNFKSGGLFPLQKIILTSMKKMSQKQ